MHMKDPIHLGTSFKGATRFQQLLYQLDWRVHMWECTEPFLVVLGLHIHSHQLRLFA